MKKLIFLLTVLCSIFLLNGCGTTSSETDKIIGEWYNLDDKSFIKIKIDKKDNEYIYSGKSYQVIMQKESSASQSPLVIELADGNNSHFDKNNVVLAKTENKLIFNIDGRKSQVLKYDPKNNTISQTLGYDFVEFKPMKNITEKEKREWADKAIKEWSDTYRAKRDGEYGIIDKIDLSLIK